MPTPPFCFGEKVMVRDEPETRELGLAGSAGQVCGIATPPFQSIEAIGSLAGDLAVHVRFADTNRLAWFAPQLLENVGRAEQLLRLKAYLTERVDDIVSFGRIVKGKELRKEYLLLAGTMEPGDELWNYSWSSQLPHMFNYEYGWCVVRDGVPVASYMIHCS